MYTASTITKAYSQCKEAVADSYRIWKESSSKFQTLRKENAQRTQRLEYLTLRVKELDSAQLTLGEGNKLSAEHARFAGAERINTALRGAYEKVFSGGREQSAMDQLKEAYEGMRRVADLDERFSEIVQRLSSAYYEAQELGFELRDILEKESFDPVRNEAIQERLDLIRRLEKRYGMTSDELVEHHEQIKDELGSLGSMGERLKHAEADYKQKLLNYRTEAARLTQARKSLATRFECMMETQLQELGMQNTRFACVFAQPAPDQKIVPTLLGDDFVSFYIAPNPGEPLKPLDKTASGGELSRLMLAMKAVGAENDCIPCMVFDEIDTGISGHIAGVVAQKMASISKYHQVLCVTHLAQIAAMADTQYLVKKHVMDERTYTNVTELVHEERIEEIARLIGVTGGHQESGFAHARAILETANQWKVEQDSAD